MARKFIAVFLGFIVFTICLWITGYFFQKEIAKFYEVGDFAMTFVSADGHRESGHQELLGRPWVANFIFTSCAGPCPILSAYMAKLQRELPGEIRLVSFSVDPDYDTPEVLREYAQRLHADPRRWFFIRGSKGALYKLMYEGFRLPLNQNKDAPPGFTVTHSTKFVLVDAKGFIRGYYDGLLERDLRELQQDAMLLLQGKGDSP